jgi:hypothetical protein
MTSRPKAGPSKRRRAELRSQMRELGSLLNEWDPASLISAGAPADEYDCLVGPLLSRLSRRPSPVELGEWLRGLVTEHFGSCPGTADFARRATAWYGLATEGAARRR